MKRLQKKFKIIKNDVELLLDIPATKQAAREYIKWHVKSADMGGWRKLPDGYAYDTSIGVFYEFRKRV